MRPKDRLDVAPVTFNADCGDDCFGRAACAKHDVDACSGLCCGKACCDGAMLNKLDAAADVLELSQKLRVAGTVEKDDCGVGNLLVERLCDVSYVFFDRSGYVDNVFRFGADDELFHICSG